MASEDPEHPLSDQEQSALEALEAALKDHDPKLEQRLSGRRNPLAALDTRTQLIVGVVGLVVGLVVVVFSFASLLPLALVGLAVAGGGLWLGVVAGQALFKKPNNKER